MTEINIDAKGAIKAVDLKSIAKEIKAIKLNQKKWDDHNIG
jgi:hypothetical protein